MSTYIESHNIISSLGFTSEENFNNVIEGVSGIKLVEDDTISSVPVQLSVINSENIENEFSNIGDSNRYTFFEKLCILSIKKAIQNSNISFKHKKTIFILSTTKGNIELIHKSHNFPNKRVHLWKTAKVISDFLGFANEPIIVSNACISGISAMILAKRMIVNGMFENAVIVGADIVSRFIVSGFQSFLSLSNEPCKPFDAKRDGLNLGEAAATIIITNYKPQNNCIEFVQGATSNDANHISGPSRTGEGLYNAIINTIVDDINIGFISAHATATLYNDNMEAVALSRANLNEIHVNGLKSYFGHTLGAAGILETIISIEAMKSSIIPKTLGYYEFGVSENIKIVDKNIHKDVNSVLKLASGFGGCNASALFKKY